MSRKRDKPLALEDRILWETVARTVTPLDAAKAIALQQAAIVATTIEKDDSAANAPSKTRLAGSTPAPIAPLSLSKRMIGSAASAPALATVAVKPANRPTNPIEPALLKRIAKGRLEVEAKIDLHGMTQGEAYMLLYGFLAEASVRHLRTVLVITGKGRSLKSEGALKRAVPMWLAQPLFARLTSGYSDAAQGHGGEGALYIRLRPSPIK
jgi:DNA-nicking Smr family endonuclease